MRIKTETYEEAIEKRLLPHDVQLRFLLFSDGVRTFCPVEQKELEQICFSSDKDTFYPDFQQTIYKELDNAPDYLLACREGLKKAFIYYQINAQALCTIANRSLRDIHERFPVSLRSTKAGFERVNEIIKELKLTATLIFAPNENKKAQKLNHKYEKASALYYDLFNDIYNQKVQTEGNNFTSSPSVYKSWHNENPKLEQLRQKKERLEKACQDAEIDIALTLSKENKVGANVSITENSQTLEKLLNTLFEEYYKTPQPTVKDICSLIQKLHLIHPFSDGNGRNICMILLTLLLLQNNFHAPLQFDTSSFIGLSLDEITLETEVAIQATKYLNQLDSHDDKEHFLMAYYFICKHSQPGQPLCTEKILQTISLNPLDFLEKTKLYFSERTVKTEKLAELLEVVSRTDMWPEYQDSEERKEEVLNPATNTLVLMALVGLVAGFLIGIAIASAVLAAPAGLTVGTLFVEAFCHITLVTFIGIVASPITAFLAVAVTACAIQYQEKAANSQFQLN